MLYKVVHYLESTGDDFGLVPDQGRLPGCEASAACCFLVESETGHCVVLQGGGELAFLEAEYAPDEWWDKLCDVGAELCGFVEKENVGRVSAGRYLFGDVNALQGEPSSESSLVSPAASARVEVAEDMDAILVELDVGAEVRLVGVLLRPFSGES